MSLLIDSGNTRLKWAWSDNGSIVLTDAVLNSQLSFTVLVELWHVLPIPQIVAVSCVNAPQTRALIVSVVRFLWPTCCVVVAQTQSVQCGVRNGYTQPEKLGVDRWLALIAVRNIYQQAACIVDCGTAITVDLIDADGQHLGGMISPGLTLMKQALSTGTQQLPYSEQNYTAGWSNNTLAGIDSGTLFAACGLIERVIALQSFPVQLILTGGDAARIAEQLACACIVDDNLVLRGLSYVA